MSFIDESGKEYFYDGTKVKEIANDLLEAFCPGEELRFVVSVCGEEKQGFEIEFMGYDQRSRPVVRISSYEYDKEMEAAKLEVFFAIASVFVCFAVAVFLALI